MAATAVKSRVRPAIEPEERTPARAVVEDRIVVPAGRAHAIGRDGKPIWRKVREDADQFSIDPSIIPEGWTYEWKRQSVYGWEDRQHQVKLGQNGWTPVPAERHAGVFTAPSYKGPIERDGLVLMERPDVLTEEARMEERRNAQAQLNGSREMAGMMPKAEIDFSHPDARRFTGVKVERQARQSEAKYNYNIDE